MSTKCTIAGGDTFHLYSDYLDEGFVWLRLGRKPAFEATSTQLAVRIPAALWEYVRRFPACDLSMAGMTDVALRILAEERVSKRTAEYLEWKIDKTAAERKRDIFSVFYLDCRKPRQIQVSELLERLRRDRDAQRSIAREIARYERAERTESKIRNAESHDHKPARPARSEKKTEISRPRDTPSRARRSPSR